MPQNSEIRIRLKELLIQCGMFLLPVFGSIGLIRKPLAQLLQLPRKLLLHYRHLSLQVCDTSGFVINLMSASIGLLTTWRCGVWATFGRLSVGLGVRS
jgi:hypothetical protein